jgi:hypothetical protein
VQPGRRCPGAGPNSIAIRKSLAHVGYLQDPGQATWARGPGAEPVTVADLSPRLTRGNNFSSIKQKTHANDIFWYTVDDVLGAVDTFELKAEFFVDSDVA